MALETLHHTEAHKYQIPTDNSAQTSECSYQVHTGVTFGAAQQHLMLAFQGMMLPTALPIAFIASSEENWCLNGYVHHHHHHVIADSSHAYRIL